MSFHSYQYSLNSSYSLVTSRMLCVLFRRRNEVCLIAKGLNSRIYPFHETFLVNCHYKIEFCRRLNVCKQTMKTWKRTAEKRLVTLQKKNPRLVVAETLT